MAFCLTAPSHYLSHYWLITKGVLQHSPESNFTRNTHELNPNKLLEDHTFKITTTTPRGQLKKICVSHCLQMVQVKFSYHHNDVMKWKHFLCYWPFVRGIHQSPVDSPHKGQCRGHFLWSAPKKKMVQQTIKTWLIWDAIALIMMSLWLWHIISLLWSHRITKHLFNKIG